MPLYDPSPFEPEESGLLKQQQFSPSLRGEASLAELMSDYRCFCDLLGADCYYDKPDPKFVCEDSGENQPWEQEDHGQTIAPARYVRRELVQAGLGLIKAFKDNEEEDLAPGLHLCTDRDQQVAVMLGLLQGRHSQRFFMPLSDAVAKEQRANVQGIIAPKWESLDDAAGYLLVFDYRSSWDRSVFLIFSSDGYRQALDHARQVERDIKQQRNNTAYVVQLEAAACLLTLVLQHATFVAEKKERCVVGIRDFQVDGRADDRLKLEVVTLPVPKEAQSADAPAKLTAEISLFEQCHAFALSYNRFGVATLKMTQYSEQPLSSF